MSRYLRETKFYHYFICFNTLLQFDKFSFFYFSLWYCHGRTNFGCPRQISPRDCFITVTSFKDIILEKNDPSAQCSAHQNRERELEQKKLFWNLRTWLDSLPSYFVQFGLDWQINWVSCHENTLNNVINHDLLIRSCWESDKQARLEMTFYIPDPSLTFMYHVCQCLGI